MHLKFLLITTSSINIQTLFFCVKDKGWIVYNILYLYIHISINIQLCIYSIIFFSFEHSSFMFLNCLYVFEPETTTIIIIATGLNTSPLQKWLKWNVARATICAVKTYFSRLMKTLQPTYILDFKIGPLQHWQSLYLWFISHLKIPKENSKVASEPHCFVNGACDFWNYIQI